jgi:hypothetical protein
MLRLLLKETMHHKKRAKNKLRKSKRAKIARELQNSSPLMIETFCSIYNIKNNLGSMREITNMLDFWDKWERLKQLTIFL